MTQHFTELSTMDETLLSYLQKKITALPQETCKTP